MDIIFKEDTHTYFVNGEIAGISVTSLLKKHGLAPDYSSVSKELLNKVAKYGTEVHKDLENVLNVKDYKPTTKQGEQYAKYVDENFECGVGEQMLAFEYGGMIIAGTADVMAIGKNGNLILGDHKNTSKFHREYVSWQVSLLDYFARKLNGESVNGHPINWKGATEFYCYHYDTSKGGEMFVKSLDKIDDREIERLLECEYNGTLYTRKELVLDKEFKLELEDAEKLLIQKELEYKTAQALTTKLRESLLNAMKVQGIKSWETDSIKVTYIEEQERMSVDSKKLKAEYPQIYTQCQKISKVKPTIRVTVKEDENGEI